MIDLSQVEDIVVGGVDPKDYPDLCDSYFESAVWKATGKELTDDELDQLTDGYPEKLNEMALASFH